MNDRGLFWECYKGRNFASPVLSCPLNCRLSNVVVYSISPLGSQLDTLETQCTSLEGTSILQETQAVILASFLSQPTSKMSKSLLSFTFKIYFEYDHFSPSLSLHPQSEMECILQVPNWSHCFHPGPSIVYCLFSSKSDLSKL